MSTADQDAAEYEALVALMVDELGHNRQYIKDFEHWDVAGMEELRKAARTAARRLKLHVITRAYRVGVTDLPSELAHSSEEFLRVMVAITDDVSPELQEKESQALADAMDVAYRRSSGS